jgi:hypothetical protein
MFGFITKAENLTMFYLSGLTHFDSKSKCYDPLKFGRGFALKFTYEHIGIQNIFSGGLYFPDPRQKGEWPAGEGRQLEGREWDRKGREGKGAGKEGEREKKEGREEGGKKRGGEVPLS